MYLFKDMLEVYCDSSFNENGSSFIGCVAVRDGVEIFQATARVIPEPLRNLECELAAIEFGIGISKMYPDAHKIIYNDSTEAVKEYQLKKNAPILVEYRARETPYQSVADRLSKRFPQGLIETYGLCKKPVEAFTADVLGDVVGGAPVLYLKKNERETTNKKTVYMLVIRTIDRVISDGKKYEARAGEVKNIKVAREVSADLSDSDLVKSIDGLDLEGAYFLLTDETWGLRLKGGEAYSVIPCGVKHHIICHEVDRSPENLFNRAAALR